MAHFAELDHDDTVLRVVAINDDDIKVDGLEKESAGSEWLANNLGGRWIRTYYNAESRKRYAGIGHKYDIQKDVFISPAPYPSWRLDVSHDWEAPIPKPADTLGKGQQWSEAEQIWKEVEIDTLLDKRKIEEEPIIENLG